MVGLIKRGNLPEELLENKDVWVVGAVPDVCVEFDPWERLVYVLATESVSVIFLFFYYYYYLSR